MAQGLILDSTLTDIADAIREKTGESGTMLPGEMAAKIAGITPGGGFAFICCHYDYGATVTCSNGTVTLTSGSSGYYVFPVPDAGPWTLTSSSGKTAQVSLSYGGSRMVYLTSALRTNYAEAYIPLSNWTVNLSDDFVLSFQHQATPAAYGNWPHFLTDSRGSTSFCVQHNFYGNRKAINFGWNGIWSGDGVVSYETPYDYTQYYCIRKSGDVFSILKNTTLIEDPDDAETAASCRLNGASVDAPLGYDAHLLGAYSAQYTGRMDTKLFYFRVYSTAGALIHDYVPYDDNGTATLRDAVDGTVQTPVGSGFTLE